MVQYWWLCDPWMLVEIYTLDSVAICDTRVGLSENLRYLLFYSNSKLIVLLSENEKGLFFKESLYSKNIHHPHNQFQI